MADYNRCLEVNLHPGYGISQEATVSEDAEDEDAAWLAKSL